mgnify:CR=1 FL=1
MERPRKEVMTEIMARDEQIPTCSDDMDKVFVEAFRCVLDQDFIAFLAEPETIALFEEYEKI